jgi:hypothetical protein
VRCIQCGEVIGVYEPLVALVDGQPRLGSRAQSRGFEIRDCYHGYCYEQHEGALPGPQAE